MKCAWLYRRFFFACLYWYSIDLHPLAYEKPRPKYSEEQLLKILLDPKVDPHCICTLWPVDITSSATFLIDITKLKHPDDVKKDNFGKWKHSGSHQTPYHVQFNEDGEVELEECAPGASGDNVFYLRRLHTSHPSIQGFAGSWLCVRFVTVCSLFS